MLMNSARTALPRFQGSQLGASLLEVLVSILLMSFGMLAIAGMQAYSIAAQKNAANRAIAGMLANELAELVRLNQTGFAAGNYDVAMVPNDAPPASTSCAFPACTAATLASADITGFQNLVRRQLPDGGVILTRAVGATSNTEADLWILWNEPTVLELVREGSATSTEATADNCPAIAKNQAVLPRCFYMKVQL